MKVEFQKDESLHDEIRVKIKASEQNITVKKLIAYLNKFNKRKRNLIPIKTDDQIVTVKVDNLIKIEVQATNLTYYTTTEVIETTGRLYQAMENLSEDFVQVSRHAVINLNYLNSIESGFADNMIAILANDLRADVSRRYLSNLEKELGL